MFYIYRRDNCLSTPVVYMFELTNNIQSSNIDIEFYRCSPVQLRDTGRVVISTEQLWSGCWLIGCCEGGRNLNQGAPHGPKHYLRRNRIFPVMQGWASTPILDLKTNRGVTAVCLSPTQPNILLTGSQDGTIRVYHLPDTKVKKAVKPIGGEISSIQAYQLHKSPDVKQTAFWVASEKQVRALMITLLFYSNGCT